MHERKCVSSKFDWNCSRTAFSSIEAAVSGIKIDMFLSALWWISHCATAEYLCKMVSAEWRLYYLILGNWHWNLSESWEMVYCLWLCWKYPNIVSYVHVKDVSREKKTTANDCRGQDKQGLWSMFFLFFLFLLNHCSMDYPTFSQKTKHFIILITLLKSYFM